MSNFSNRVGDTVTIPAEEYLRLIRQEKPQETRWLIRLARLGRKGWGMAHLVGPNKDGELVKLCSGSPIGYDLQDLDPAETCVFKCQKCEFGR